MSYFFLSYAHRDAIGNTWFNEFFTRLALEVGRAAALPSDVKETDIGFFDKGGLEVGADWPTALAEALQSCKVFVCLYSKSYFKSPDCGREFEVFRSRVASYTPPTGSGAPRLIIPVLWDRLPETLPKAVSNLQYTHSDFGQKYAERGLLYLMKMLETVEVENVLSELGNRIAEEAERHPLPRLATLKPLREVQSAFHESLSAPLSLDLDLVTRGDLPDTATPPSISGPDAAWYVYLAGRREDYQGKRKDMSCYGDRGGYQWKPLLPPKPESIGAIMPIVVGEKGLSPHMLPVSKELIKHLQKAEEENTITILVVDPWSVKVESYNQLMRDYDRYRLDNCAVIIVWNGADPETAERREELKEGLNDVFERNLRVVDEVFRDSVQTEQELLTDLAAVIEKIRERLAERAKPARSVPHNGGESFPNINGAA